MLKRKASSSMFRLLNLLCSEKKKNPMSYKKNETGEKNNQDLVSS